MKLLLFSDLHVDTTAARRLVERARTAPVTTSPMLAQIATQARVLLAR